ncbi:tannase and feruloyl esterase [Cryphonectria parasitica EP155]|uniref:Carboxylic ester hydrolase n=1 Tax=Cryphonectria parasitica (strain ATCC 38755 / EP155) TaxID=660469 RepID=A0A9P4Y556_CRYP1|nr:tannase and feruloyl esterase [Cryphonectria parasitica EP155]KAF3766542.1 tannase and feruloyl esterase [Cryphonectria parasitica EP155]
MRRVSLTGLAALAKAASAIDCSFDSIKTILPAGVELSFAQPIEENGTFIVPTEDIAWPVDPINLPKLCAVAATVTSAENGTYGFGIFLPDDWNGRTLTVGNGGLAGGVIWSDMVRDMWNLFCQGGHGTGVKYGHAVISTDTGHNSTTTDATWAANDTIAQTNWGWRALHESVVMGKAIIEAYYGTAPSYHYYQGCSTGGRQGFKEAQMFPDDFDGVIAGAPAWWTQIWQFWLGYVNYISNVTEIPVSMFDPIAKEVLRQCDGQDGLVDTIISDPYGCNFDTEQLLCPANVTNATEAGCLTAAQLQTYITLASDFVETNSTLVFPKWLLGSEHFWDLNIDGGAPNIIGLGYIQYFLGLGSDWDWRDFDDDVVQLSEELNAGEADADHYDMTEFFQKGKKFIHYQGLSDGGISTGASFYMYDHVHRAMAPQGVVLDDFYRFFPIPGMGHCTDTPDFVNAPYYIGGISMTNNGQYSVPGYMNAQHDVLLALMGWVENGTAPDYIIGTAYNNFTTQDAVTRQRPICPHPKQAKYAGEGDPNDPESWTCQLLY